MPRDFPTLIFWVQDKVGEHIYHLTFCVFDIGENHPSNSPWILLCVCQTLKCSYGFSNQKEALLFPPTSLAKPCQRDPYGLSLVFTPQTPQDMNKLLWRTHLVKTNQWYGEYLQRAGSLILPSVQHKPHRKEAKTTRILWNITLSGLEEVEKKCTAELQKEHICQTSRSIPV